MNSTSEAVRFYAFLFFLLICVMGGGASRGDVLSLLYLRPAAILCLIVFAVTPGRWEFRRFRVPFLLLGLLAATMIVQLIPLPPSLWLGLPGHARFAGEAAAAGMPVPWWSMSLSPDLTLNSLLALLPPLVVLVGLAAIREDQRRALLPVLIGIVCADAVWSILQFAGGGDSPAYLYAVTSHDTPVGIFSNRNHHAALLALGFPMLATWLRMPSRSREHSRTRLWMAGALGLFLVPGILVTGSRAGVALGVAGMVAAFFLAPSIRIGPRGWWRRVLPAAAGIVLLGLVAVTFLVNRAPSLERLTGSDNLAEEARAKAVPTLLRMIREFAPQGTGYGTFDPAYRMYEPDFALAPTYLNHAHNDLIELALTGGVPALIVLGLFLLWWLIRGARSFFPFGRSSLGQHFARLGAVVILFLLGASLVDYPLRTPLIAIVLVIACGWLSGGRRAGEASEDETAAAAAAVATRSKAGWTGRLAVALLLAAGLGWVAMGVTAANTIGRIKPEIVLSWWPFDSSSRITAATLVLQRQRGRQAWATAGRLSLAALDREPLNVGAVRTLGILAGLRGEAPRAERLMRFSETLSRRDLATQLWLIENSVQHNDIAGALSHYDRALRTSPAAGDILFPILVQASATRDVMGPVARLVAQRPVWWRDFARRLVAESQSPAAIATILGGLRLNPADPPERDLLVVAFRRLTETRNYGPALRLYQQAMGARALHAPVRNGGFQSADNPLPPFDWSFVDQLDLAGRIQAPGLNADQTALVITSGNGANGEVARQLLVLGPGRYRLTMRTGNIVSPPEERPQIVLTCGDSSTEIVHARLPESPATGSAVGQDFTIPASRCPAQWLSIRATGPLNGTAPELWIDDIAVHPRS